MNHFSEIVQESADSVQTRFFNSEDFNKKLNSLKDVDGTISDSDLISLILEYSSGYAGTLLAETLERLEEEGYINK